MREYGLYSQSKIDAHTRFDHVVPAARADCALKKSESSCTVKNTIAPEYPCSRSCRAIAVPLRSPREMSKTMRSGKSLSTSAQTESPSATLPMTC